MQMGIRVCAGVVVAVLIAVGAPTARANHYFTHFGWRDKHVLYPPVPSGYTEITRVFGQPCNALANDNRTFWTAPDNDHSYPVYYHYKLGGYGKFYGGTGSTKRSSNFNNDVRGHIRNEHYGPTVKSGIWGYACRKIAGSAKWSTHAWGIAVDINAAYEHVGSAHHHCHTVASGLAKIWKNHRWTHGVTFGDCMHFQYATNY